MRILNCDIRLGKYAVQRVAFPTVSYVTFNKEYLKFVSLALIGTQDTCVFGCVDTPQVIIDSGSLFPYIYAVKIIMFVSGFCFFLLQEHIHIVYYNIIIKIYTFCLFYIS